MLSEAIGWGVRAWLGQTAHAHEQGPAEHAEVKAKEEGGGGREGGRRVALPIAGQEGGRICVGMGEAEDRNRQE